METTLTTRRWGVSLLAALLTAAVMVPATAARAAAPTDLLISEYVEGSGLNKAVEFHNGTDAPIALSGYELFVSFNGGSSTRAFALNGEVAAGDAFVFAHEDLAAYADQTTNASLWNGDDFLALRTTDGTVVDSLGTLGVDPGSSWGTPSTANNTLRRNADVCTGDTVVDDAFDPSTEWTEFGNDTFDGLGSHTLDCDGSGGGSDVVINEFSASTTGTDVEYVELYGPADTDVSDLTVLEVEGDSPGQGVVEGVFDATGSTDAGGFALLDLPANALENSSITLLLVRDFTGAASDDLDSDDDGSLDATPWSEVLDAVAVVTDDAAHAYGQPALGPDYDGVSSFPPGGASRIPDGTDTDTAADWVRNDFDLGGIGNNPGTLVEGEAYNTPGAPNEAFVDDGGGGGDGTPVFVHDVQGDGAASPLDGDLVEVQAVVTSLFTDDDTLDAFFVQEEDDDADADDATSEGVFVFCRGFCPADLAVGDLVTVTGEVDEFFGMTQLEPASGDDIVVDASGVALPTATEVALPAGGSTLAEATFESVEGMVVTFPGTLAVSEYFELARYGQLVLTADERPFQFTHDSAPSVDGYAAFLDDLATRRIILDDDNNDQNDMITGAVDEPYPYPTASWGDGGLSLDSYVRGGDTVEGLTGVLHWSFAGQSGTDAWRVRPIDGLDYTFDRVNPRTDAPDDVGGSLTVASFNVLNYFTSIDDGTNVCQAGCRGADSEAEFVRQQDKIVSALAAIDADIVGLIEIENNDTAVANLAEALNAEVGAGTYAAVETGEIGTDSIKVGFIHKTATVEAVGDHAILDSSVDPDFIDTKNRPALAQTFREVETGGVFTAAVNHLKSKGSDCADIGEDETIEDGQANCSETRALAAQALADWLATDPTGSGDEDVMILGDLNAYRMEDAIVALEDAGYTDLNEAFGGDDAYTYVFDGQLGYLDYAMTNPSLTEQVTGTTQWHINADEVPVFDYNDAIEDATEASFERESDALPIYAPDPYRSSDHDPVIVGLDLEPTDVTPPTLEVSVDPAVINDRNHKYVEVTATITVSDDLDDDVDVTLVSATSNEPDNGLGDGDTADDLVVVSDTEFLVRAERSGTGDGRVYTLTWVATDDAGNTTTATATVTVPK